MSYEIIYDRAFIKVDDKRTIPFLLMGSNNCYDLNNKRARDWGNASFHTDGIIGDNEAILKSIDDYRASLIERDNEGDFSSKYDDKHFGWFTSLSFYGKSTSATTFSAYKSYFANGIKTARTIEEYKELGITFDVHVYCWDKQKDFIDKGIEYKERVYLNSTQHLIDTVKEFEDYYKPFGYVVYLTSHISEYTAKRLKAKKVPKQKEVKDLTRVWVLECLQVNGYFIKNGGRSYRYATWSDYAKKFTSEKQANTFHSKMRNKDMFKVEPLEGSFRVLV
jgi:hypothetical protein